MTGNPRLAGLAKPALSGTAPADVTSSGSVVANDPSHGKRRASRQPYGRQSPALISFAADDIGADARPLEVRHAV